jgi:hypothetical protein
MTSDMSNAPPHEAGALLLNLGTPVSVHMADLTEGDLVLHVDGPYVVVRTAGSRLRSNRHLLVRDVDGSTLRNVLKVPDAWVRRLELPEATMSQFKPGDVVRYLGSTVAETTAAAIRHHAGWSRTVGPWLPMCDLEILVHLSQGRALVVRSTLRPGEDRRRRMPVGTVVATADRKLRDPTVWIRTGRDHWAGSARGLTASDVMINYELDRGTYETVWIPEKTT